MILKQTQSESFNLKVDLLLDLPNCHICLQDAINRKLSGCDAFVIKPLN